MKYPGFEHFTIITSKIAFAFRIQTQITMDRESLCHSVSHVSTERRRKGDERQVRKEMTYNLGTV